MTVLGIDPGTRRVGVAVSDPADTLALPLTVITRGEGDEYIAAIVAIARERVVDRVVVGLPRKLDGSEGPEARAARLLADRLASELEVEVDMLDERFTTRIAEGAMRAGNVSARKQRPVVDKVAATLLLQGYLDARKVRAAGA